MWKHCSRRLDSCLLTQPNLDLFAVLTPCGPLRLLIQSSQQRNQPIPALLYSVAIWMMASPPEAESPSSGEYVIESRENSYQMTPSAESPNHRSSSLPLPPPPTYQSTPHRTSPTSNIPTMNGNNQVINNQRSFASSESLALSTAASVDGGPSVDGTQTNLLAPPATSQQPVNSGNTSTDDEEERSGLKLGLGDFVFYSVLVARAGMNSPIMVISSFLDIVSKQMSGSLPCPHV